MVNMKGAVRLKINQKMKFFLCFYTNESLSFVILITKSDLGSSDVFFYYFVINCINYLSFSGTLAKHKNMLEQVTGFRLS